MIAAARDRHTGIHQRFQGRRISPPLLTGQADSPQNSSYTLMDSMISLRVMRIDDIPDGLRLCRASGWNQLAPDWERFLGSNAGGCRVALDDAGKVIGSVATLRFAQTFAWIAMVLVDPAYRRAGIGTRLLHEALRLLDDMPAVGLDATPSGFHVYEPAGFREEYRLQRMERTAIELMAPIGPAEAGHHIRRMADEDLDEVFRWDAQVFGADRRALLESFRDQAPTYAWIAGRSPIAGYAFGRPGYLFEHLGPIVARDEDTAKRLVSACLAAHPNRPFIVDVSVRRSWVEWLESQQFVLQRPFIRMYRGKRAYRDRPAEMFAIAGPEFA
jgi:GNAT superfamily N-acetyltransferase